MMTSVSDMAAMYPVSPDLFGDWSRTVPWRAEGRHLVATYARTATDAKTSIGAGADSKGSVPAKIRRDRHRQHAPTRRLCGSDRAMPSAGVAEAGMNRQQERSHNRRAVVERTFDEMLRLVADGVPLIRAIGMVPGRPTINTVRVFMRNRPDQYRRFQDAKRAALGSTGRSLYPRAAWDAALRSIATAPEALTQIKRQGEPDYNACLRRKERDPDFRLRYEAAIEERFAARRPVRFDQTAYDDALAHLMAHPERSLGDLDADLVSRRLPHLGSIYSMKYRNPKVAAAWADISASRGVRRFEAEAHAEAAEILRTQPVQARAILKRAAGRLPSLNAMRSKALANGFIAEIMADSATARRDARAQAKADRIARRGARAAARTKAAAERGMRPVYRLNVLKSDLLLDELYREASALFHRGLPGDTRDDLISEVVVAVLEGRLAREDIKRDGASIGWRALRGVNGRQMQSLDELMIASDRNSASRGEMVSADHWSFEDAI